MNAMGSALGKGLRGYRDRESMKEYAGMISGAQANSAEIASIQAEINRLEQRNLELKQLMRSEQPAYMQQPQQQQPEVPQPFEYAPPVTNNGYMVG